MLNTATILKIYENKIVAISTDGAFILLKKKDNCYIGQNIFYTENDILNTNNKSKVFPILSVAASIMIIFGLYFFVSIDKPIEDPIKIISPVESLAQNAPSKEILSSLLPTITPSLTSTENASIQTTSMATETPKGSRGLNGFYYNNVDFTDLALNRIDPIINYNWDTSTPDKSIVDNNYSIRWVGKINPKYSEKTTFYIKSFGGGVRLWINGNLVISNWKETPEDSSHGDFIFDKNKSYDIVLEYFHRKSKNGDTSTINTSGCTLEWKSSSLNREFVPQSCLIPGSLVNFTQNKGLIGEYYSDLSFSNLVFQKTVPTIDFYWFGGNPFEKQSNSTNFSCRWRGFIYPKFSEEYTLYTNSDDGVRLWINEKLLIDNWKPHTLKSDYSQISFKANSKYSIKLEYFNTESPGQIILAWSSNSQPKQIIPNEFLSTN